jgi:TonB family protein
MNFQKIIKSIRLVTPVAALLVIAACNNNTSDEKLNTKKAPEEETRASEPVKAKKGKASVTSTKATTEKMEKDKNGIYLRAEVMPEYPGGDAALSNYISDNIDYGQEAIENNRQGTVMVSFVVDEKGKVSDAKVMNHNVDASLEQDAIRVVKQMPEWEPGKVKGKNVKTWMHLPITFRIEE